MEKKTHIDEQEFTETPISGLEGGDQYKEPEKGLDQTLQDEKKTKIDGTDDLVECRETDREKARELSDGLVGGDAKEDLQEPKLLSAKEISEKLQRALCCAYDIYLHAKKSGEHCPIVGIGDYAFAARGFTCGRVDFVKVFKKSTKKVLLVFKTSEYVPVEITKDVVNILAKAGGVLEPLTDEILQKM